MLSLPVPVKICALKKDAKIFCKFFSHLLIKFDKWKSSAKEIWNGFKRFNVFQIARFFSVLCQDIDLKDKFNCKMFNGLSGPCYVTTQMWKCYVVSFIFVKMIKPLELTTPLPGYLCRPRSLGKNKTTISKIKTIC